MLTMSRTSPIYRKWYRRIESGTFTKAECNQWAHAVSALANGEEPRGAKTSLSAEEASKLSGWLKLRGGVGLTQLHEDAGLLWLLKYGKKYLHITDEQMERFYIDFTKFTFEGDAIAYRPVWICNFETGPDLCYFAYPWVSHVYDSRVNDFGGWWLR